MHALVCRAIRERRIVRFHYDEGIREVEPHCHGCSKDGHDLLRGYQVRGHSRSGHPVGWKMFRLDEVSVLVVTEHAFNGPRAGYDPADNKIATVYCSL